jgi:hypothetical protein
MSRIILNYHRNFLPELTHYIYELKAVHFKCSYFMRNVHCGTMQYHMILFMFSICDNKALGHTKTDVRKSNSGYKMSAV